MAEGERFNLKNPGVKRILQEVKELHSNPSDEYMSLPLEDNIFEWQFAIRGPKDTEFEGGVYHGRIQLPPEYPFKPPAFMLLTPNGRFETLTKICLSISAHHPEHWQPSWSVRTALVALIAFLPTKPEGALGSLDYTKDERRTLAIKSREAAPKFGSPDRQKLIDEIHSHMLSKVHPVPELVAETAGQDSINETTAQGGLNETAAQDEHHAVNETVEDTNETDSSASSSSIVERDASSSSAVSPAAAAAPVVARRQQRQQGDYGLTLLAAGLAMAIVALVVKKVLRLYGYIV